MEPVALQVRCSHCHRRRCNSADCRCAAVTAIRHPARARSQLIRLTMGWHVLWSQWRCSGHCDGSGLDASRLNSARADLLCAWAKRRSDCRRCDCHRRRCNCADCRCAAVTAIRHPARARSQRATATDGGDTASSQSKVAARFDSRWAGTCSGASGAASPLHSLPPTQVQQRRSPRTRDLRRYCQCGCKSAAFTAIDAGATVVLPPTQVQLR